MRRVRPLSGRRRQAPPRRRAGSDARPPATPPVHREMSCRSRRRETRRCSRTRSRNGMLVSMPRIGKSRSAVDQPGDRQVARFGRGDDLGEQRIVVHRNLVAFAHAGVDADAGHAAARGRAAAVPPAAETLRRDPRRRRAPRSRGRAGCRSRLRPRQRLAGGDTSSCARTRSTPTTASVTPCSTCSRVFISRK